MKIIREIYSNWFACKPGLLPINKYLYDQHIHSGLILSFKMVFLLFKNNLIKFFTFSVNYFFVLFELYSGNFLIFFLYIMYIYIYIHV